MYERRCAIGLPRVIRFLYICKTKDLHNEVSPQTLFKRNSHSCGVPHPPGNRSMWESRLETRVLAAAGPSEVYGEIKVWISMRAISDALCSMRTHPAYAACAAAINIPWNTRTRRDRPPHQSGRNRVAAGVSNINYTKLLYTHKIRSTCLSGASPFWNL